MSYIRLYWRRPSGFVSPADFPCNPPETTMTNAINTQLSREQQIAALEKDWASNPRWKGITRNYSAADVVRLRGSVNIEHTLAQRGAEKLWRLVNGESKKGYVNSYGAISAGQAMQQANQKVIDLKSKTKK